MRSHISVTGRAALAAVLLAQLAACGKSEPTQPVPPPQLATPPDDSPPPRAALQSAPATAPQASTSTRGPASTSTPTPAAGTATGAGAVPELSSMKLATASGKIGVPVDLRYQIDGDALSGAPVTLHLAAVPRVAGSHLEVSISDDPGIEVVRLKLSAEKVSAETPYRQELALRRLPGGPAEVRVLVTMDAPIGRGFTYFNLPLGAAAPGTAGKQR